MKHKTITMGEIKQWRNEKWDRTKELNIKQIKNKENEKQ